MLPVDNKTLPSEFEAAEKAYKAFIVDADINLEEDERYYIYWEKHRYLLNTHQESSDKNLINALVNIGIKHQAYVNEHPKLYLTHWINQLEELGKLVLRANELDPTALKTLLLDESARRVLGNIALTRVVLELSNKVKVKRFQHVDELIKLWAGKLPTGFRTKHQVAVDFIYGSGVYDLFIEGIKVDREITCHLWDLKVQVNGKINQHLGLPAIDTAVAPPNDMV